MRIHEVCKKLGVTKKAIEYYIKQDLLSLDVLDNGYRNFKEEHIERLRKIIVLRRLGLGTREIKQALSKPEALKHMSIKNELRLTYENARHILLQRLSNGEAWVEIEIELRAIEQQATITSKLLDAFPGEFGQFITLHFSHFLPNSITSEEQQAAAKTLQLQLDSMNN